MSDRPYDDGEGDDDRPKPKGGFGRPQRKEADKARRDRGRSEGRGGRGGRGRGRDDRGGHRGQNDRGGYRGGDRQDGGGYRGGGDRGYRGGSDRNDRGHDRGGYRGGNDRGGGDDRGGYRGNRRDKDGHRGGRDHNDGGGYRGGRDNNDRGGYRGGRDNNDRGGYRGGRDNNDRGGYRGGRDSNDRGGYRGGRDNNDRGGYRGGRDNNDRGGYRGGRDRNDRVGQDRGGYRGNDRGGYQNREHGGRDRGQRNDRSGGYRGRDDRGDHKRDDRSQRHERGREHNRQSGEDPKRRERHSAPGRTDFRAERAAEYARNQGDNAPGGHTQEGEHRPQPRPRDEIRVCGENACRAVMEKRPEDVRRLWIRADLMHRFGLMLKDMAQRKLPYHEADDDELERVSESRHHEGVVLALHEPPLRWAQVVDELGDNCLVVAADHVDNPHNLGAIVRSGAHFGVTTLVLAHPGKLSASARRVAEGGAEAVRTVTVRDFKRALEQMTERGVQIVAADQNAEMSIYDVDLTAPTCLLLGNERHGLDAKLRPLATHVVRVPGTGAVESLNVAATAASLLAESWRQRHPKSI